MQISQEDISRFDRMLSASSRVIVVTHVHPDGDAVGSACAMQTYLQSRMPHASVTLLFCGRPSANVSYILDGCSEGTVLFADEDEYSTRLDGADLMICLDFNDFSRTDTLEHDLKSKSCPKVLIDHHIGPSVEDFDLVFSQTKISSASELLFWILGSMPDVAGDFNALPYQCRLALMSGMTTDTNNFANSVFPSTLQMASTLLATGVDRDYIIERLYNSCRENRLRMIGFLLSERMKITPYGVAYTLLDENTVREYDIREGDLEGYVNMPLTIDRVKMSIYIREDGDKMRVSIRSKRGVSANMCSRRYFGGGGHEQAAGGRLPLFESLEKLEEYVLVSTAEFFGVL